MFNFDLIHHNYIQLIFISSSLSLQGGMCSRRRKCKMTYNFECLYLQIMDFGALSFKIKSMARLHGFESSWTFCKACFKGYKFHVLSFIQFKVELCEKMP